jgi:hypothetical protein
MLGILGNVFVGVSKQRDGYRRNHSTYFGSEMARTIRNLSLMPADDAGQVSSLTSFVLG